jgi:hypothetical protein
MVPQDQVLAAKEVLSRVSNPIDPDETGDTTPPDEHEADYVDEPLRCPKCGRRGVETARISRGLKLLAGCILLLLISSVVVQISIAVVPRAFRDVDVGSWLPIWIAAIVAISIPLIFSKRQRRCPHCHHAWKRGMD